jgi:peptide deformylase
MSKILTVLQHPDPKLREVAKEISVATLEQLNGDGYIDDLITTMHEKDGVGIAATQVGTPYRIFVALDGDDVQVYVNPVLSKLSFLTDIDVEGCLSVPGVAGLVKRSKRCTLSGIDRNGHPILRRADGLLARIFQHEVDHLDGVLFIDRATKTHFVADGDSPRV